MARAIQQKGVAQDIVVDSAALVGYHSGSLPDERALSVLENHGIKYTNEARVITQEDFQDFDYIFGMDPGNVSELKKRAPANCKAQILLLGDYGLKKEEKIIHDPYYVSRVSNTKLKKFISLIISLLFLFSLLAKNRLKLSTNSVKWPVRLFCKHFCHLIKIVSFL